MKKYPPAPASIRAIIIPAISGNVPKPLPASGSRAKEYSAVFPSVTVTGTLRSWYPSFPSRRVWVPAAMTGIAAGLTPHFTSSTQTEAPAGLVIMERVPVPGAGGAACEVLCTAVPGAEDPLAEVGTVVRMVAGTAVADVVAEVVVVNASAGMVVVVTETQV